MLSLRNRFGVAGIASVIALVFALVGGAYAADGGSGDSATASAKNRKGGGNVNKLIKRESRKFSKRFSLAFSKRFPGPIGPQGVPGLPGAPGSDGDDGDDGEDGQNGTNGKSVEVSGAAPGCTEGGATVQVEGEPGTAQEVCNGEDGSPWTAGGTLPSGATLAGAWSIGTSGPPAAFEFFYVPISFSLPLEEDLDGAHVHFLNPAGEELVSGGGGIEEVPPTGCGSAIGPEANAENPEAAPGHLCVYASFMNANFQTALPPKATNPGQGEPPVEGAATTGALIGFLPKEKARAFGTWAVTAP